jgi:hypothetical protein
MHSYQGRSLDDMSDEERSQVETQIPGDSDDYSIRMPRETIEPPRTPARQAE